MATGDEDLEVGVKPQLEGQQQFLLEFNRTMEQAAKSTRHIGKGFDRATKDITDAGKGLGGVAKAFENMGKAANQSVTGFKKASIGADEFADDVAILEKRIEATRKTLAKSGADPDIFGSLDLQLRKLLKFQAEFEQDFERAAKDEDAAKAYRLKFNAISKAITGELGEVNRAVISASKLQTSAFAQTTAGIVADGRVQQAAIKKQTAVLTNEAQIVNAATRASARERIAIVNKERAEFVTAQQREGAQILAETRATNQRRLQSERQFQRTRLELLRFTLAQIRSLERTVGRIFSGTLNVIQRTIGAIANQTQRLGKVFTRGNRELNDGLQPALLSRERSISRSFERQNAIVSSAVIRQSRTIERFQAQASTGLAGAATGRSALGGLLGGGLAIGGGFLIFDRLRAGFDEAVNFNEALNKTRVIFGDVSSDIEKFAEGSVEALFSTGSAALAAAANFGVFGKSAGLTGKPLADFAKRMTVLATDLASFSNTNVEDAVTAIGAALRGESEPIRKYGVLLNEAVLQQRALDLGIIDTLRTLKPSERVLAAYNEILAQTTDAQGDAARTADDFANSSRRAAAASVETAAAIASAFVPVATFFTNFSFKILPRITDFIEGNVGPGLEILRDGLIGVGGAIAALVAARGAIEVLQFLAIALRAVATPMGLFVAAVAGLGAAINIFRQRSPEFAAGVRQITSVLQDVLSGALDLATTGLDKLGNLIDDTVLPALERFARFAGRALRTALEFVIGFVVTVIIPGFRAFANLLTDTVLPALRDLGSAIRDRVGPALRFLRDTAGDALDKILPFLDPVIDGFQRLATAIFDAARAAATGNFSGIIDSLKGFVTGLPVAQLAVGAGLAAIGTAIGGPIGAAIGLAIGFGLGASLDKIEDKALEILGPQLLKVQNFVQGFFTQARVERMAVGFLEFVRVAGRTIGDAISDPRFIAALEAILAIGIATGFQFVRGFVEGVARNLPALTRQLGRHLELLVTEAFKIAVSNPLILAKIFGAIFLASAFLGTIRNNAARAGGEAATGFVGGFGRTVKGSFSRNTFLAGFFGGTQGIQSEAARFADKAGAAMVTERDRALRNLRRLGGDTELTRVFVGGTGGITVAATDARKELDKLVAKVGTTRAAGAQLRGAFADAFRSVGESLRGAGGVLSGRGVTAGLDRIKTGLAGLKTAAGDAFATLRTNFRTAGAELGQSLGGAILAGVGAALSGQQLGRADSAGGKALGIAGIVSSALFAGAAAAPTGFGPVVAAAVAGLGLVTAALTSASEAAKKARQETREYTEALRGLGGAEAAAKATETVLTNLESESKAVRDLFIDVGFNARTFTDEVLAGSFDITDALDTLAPAFGSAAGEIGAAVDGLARDGIGIEEGFRRAANAGDLSTASVNDLRLALEGLPEGVDVDVIIEALDLLLDESGELRAGLEDATQFDTFRRNAVAAFNQAALAQANLQSGAFDTANVFEARLAGSVEGATSAASDLGDKLVNGFSRARVFVDDFGQRVVLAGRTITEGLGEPIDFVGDALKRLNEQRLADLNDEIDATTGKLQEARDAVVQTLENIALLSGGVLADPLQQAVDSAVLALPNIAQAVNEAFASSTQGVDFNTAELNEALRPFQTQAEAIFAQAREKWGKDLSVAKLREEFAPLQRTLDSLTVPEEVTLPDGTVEVRQVAISSETRNQLQGILDGFLADPLVTAQIDQLAIQQAAVEQLEADLAALHAQIPLDAVFSSVQVAEAIAAAFPDGAQIPIDENSLVARQLGLDPLTFDPNAANFGQTGVVGAEIANDPALRAQLAAQIATILGPASTGTQQPTTVVQGDVVAQKVETQSFVTADAQEAAAAQARQMRAAARSSLPGQLLSFTAR